MRKEGKSLTVSEGGRERGRERGTAGEGSDREEGHDGRERAGFLGISTGVCVIHG